MSNERYSGHKWLCEAWGETDLPCACICADRAGVEQFVIREWLGSADDPELPNIMARFDEHDWGDGALDWEFEIGGVSIKRIFESGEAKSPAVAGVAVATHWLIFFEDADRDCEVFTDEAAARKRYADISVSWNAHLFAKVDSNHQTDTPAPAGEREVATCGICNEGKLQQFGDGFLCSNIDCQRYATKVASPNVPAAPNEAPESAREEINACVRRIQIICDDRNLDPNEFLAESAVVAPAQGVGMPEEVPIEFLRRVAVLANVWPEQDEINCPVGILSAVRKYYNAIRAHCLALAKGRET